jgi:hypothetical protein
MSLIHPIPSNTKVQQPPFLWDPLNSYEPLSEKANQVAFHGFRYLKEVLIGAAVGMALGFNKSTSQIIQALGIFVVTGTTFKLTKKILDSAIDSAAIQRLSLDDKTFTCFMSCLLALTMALPEQRNSLTILSPIITGYLVASNAPVNQLAWKLITFFATFCTAAFLQKIIGPSFDALSKLSLLAGFHALLGSASYVIGGQNTKDFFIGSGLYALSSIVKIAQNILSSCSPLDSKCTNTLGSLVAMVTFGSIVNGIRALVTTKTAEEERRKSSEEEKVANFWQAILKNHFATAKKKQEDRKDFKENSDHKRICLAVTDQLIRIESEPTENNLPLYLSSRLVDPKPFIDLLKELRSQYRQLSEEQKKQLDIFSKEEPKDTNLVNIWNNAQKISQMIDSRNWTDQGKIFWTSFKETMQNF